MLDLALDLCATSYQTMNAPLATRGTATRTFPLLELPPELRAIIFEPLIQAGDLSILRVSKFINQEAVSLLKKVAILRINKKRPGMHQTTIALTAKITEYGDLTWTAPDYIQNLDICFDIVRRSGFRVNKEFIRYFAGNQIARRSCKITILFGFLGPVPNPLEEDTTYRVIASLTGFRFLTLKFEYSEVPMLRIINTMVTDDPDLIRKALSRDYKQVSGFLARDLGPAKLNDSLGEPYLSFKPRAFKPSLLDHLAP